MKTLLLVIQLIPAVINLIRAIEEAIPEAGFGAEKLKAVKEILQASYDGMTEIWPIVEKIIAIVVSMFNKTGKFSIHLPLTEGFDRHNSTIGGSPGEGM